MERRLGWAILAGIGAFFLVVTAVGYTLQAALELADGRGGAALETVGLGVLVVVFWRWIMLGAWLRYRPPLDPETGQPVRVAEQIGPWGVVGRVLLMVIVVGFMAIGVAVALSSDRSTKEAEKVQDRAEFAARDLDLTVADLRAANVDHQAWAINADGQPDPYRALIHVKGATVIDVAVVDDHGSILLRLPNSPPCVVVDIDRHELISSRLINNCG